MDEQKCVDQKYRNTNINEEIIKQQLKLKKKLKKNKQTLNEKIILKMQHLLDNNKM